MIPQIIWTDNLPFYRTRGQFVAELMQLWEDSIQKLTKDGYNRAAEEVKTALQVLEKTYSGSDLEPKEQS